MFLNPFFLWWIKHGPRQNKNTRGSVDRMSRPLVFVLCLLVLVSLAWATFVEVESHEMSSKVDIKASIKRSNAKIKASINKSNAKVKASFQKAGQKIKTSAQKTGKSIKSKAKKVYDSAVAKAKAFQAKFRPPSFKPAGALWMSSFSCCCCCC